MTLPYSPTEIMTVVAARALSNDDVVFVGIGAPSAACNLARLSQIKLQLDPLDIFHNPQSVRPAGSKR